MPPDGRFTPLTARAAAHQSWAFTDDRAARTAAARKGFLDRFNDLVDPSGQLSPAERERRATSARKAHFARLAQKSAAARARTRPDGATPSTATTP